MQHVALGDDARALAVGIEHDGGADAALGHQRRRLAQRVARPHRQDHRAHAVPHLHLSHLPLVATCNDRAQAYRSPARRRWP